MVCSLERGRMAVMVRLLVTGGLSQTITEEIGNHKLASHHRDLHDADEANLLDEEDMHVFESKPMVDHLHLVCCNACKKPIKASQYAAHVERCRSLSSRKEILMELDGNRGNKKPPRKGRKKLPTTPSSQTTIIIEQESYDLIGANEPAATEAQLYGQMATSSPFFVETKRNPACVVTPSTKGDSRVSTGNKDSSSSVYTPPAKRSKVIRNEHLLSDGLEVASGVTKDKTTQDACSYIPVPLATKMYYSQRNNRLRAALGHLYSAIGNQICNEPVTTQASKENMRPLAASAQNDSLERIDGHPNSPIQKKDGGSSPSEQKSNHNIAQSSEACIGKSQVSVPATNFSNQLPVDNVTTHQTHPVGLIRSKYFPKPYPFVGKSGNSLGSMHQPKGSVPVT